MSTTIEQINDFIQAKLRESKIESASPVEITYWLVEAGLRGKIESRPGSYIRSLCRKGKIRGSEQKDKSWRIRQV